VDTTTNSQGQVVQVASRLGALFGIPQDPWVKALEGTKYSGADREQMRKLFGFLAFCLEQVRGGESAYASLRMRVCVSRP